MYHKTQTTCREKSIYFRAKILLEQYTMCLKSNLNFYKEILRRKTLRRCPCTIIQSILQNVTTRELYPMIILHLHVIQIQLYVTNYEEYKEIEKSFLQIQHNTKKKIQNQTNTNKAFKQIIKKKREMSSASGVILGQAAIYWFHQQNTGQLCIQTYSCNRQEKW